jgi:hypothetical protein
MSETQVLTYRAPEAPTLHSHSAYTPRYITSYFYCISTRGHQA